MDKVITVVRLPHPLANEWILHTISINDRGVSLTFLSPKKLLDVIDSFVSLSKSDKIKGLRDQVLLEKEAEISRLRDQALMEKEAVKV